jgi:hypothetical protein
METSIILERIPQPRLLGGQMPTRPGIYRVPVMMLSVEPSYQRPFNPEWAHRKAENWEDYKAGTLLVSCRDGKLFIIDGQQRAGTAKLIDPEMCLVCRVLFGLTIEEEAKRCAELNEPGAHRNFSRPDLHKTKIAQGDKVATELSHLLYVNLLSFRKGEVSAYIGCVGTVSDIFRANPECGRWLIRFIGQAVLADRTRLHSNVRIEFVSALAQTYNIRSIRDNADNLAKHLGQTLGVEGAAKRIKLHLKGDRTRALVEECLEYNRPKTKRLIDAVEVATVLSRSGRKR